MSDLALPIDPTPTDWASGAMQQRLRKRYAAERRFRLLGLAAVLISAGFLAFLLATMMANGLRGFTETQVRLDIGPAEAAAIAAGNYEAAVPESLYSPR